MLKYWCNGSDELFLKKYLRRRSVGHTCGRCCSGNCCTK